MTEGQTRLLEKIELPIGGNEVLEVDLDELQGAEEQDQIIGIMLEDKVSLKFFVQFAVRCVVLIP
jgi:hypothetical protein